MISHEMQGIITGLVNIEEYIYLLMKDQLVQLNKEDLSQVKSLKVFKKEGFTRDLVGNAKFLVARDFYTLNIFDTKTLECQFTVELGTDLKNDICGMLLDDHILYASIRNGKIVKIDLNKHQVIQAEEYTCGSIWTLVKQQSELIGCNVDGEITFFDADTLTIKQKLKISRQNIGSMILHDNYIYTAGQDKAIHKISLETKDIVIKKSSAHKRMFDCVGVYKDSLITICHPGNEICRWDKQTLDLKKRIVLDLHLSGRTCRLDNRLLVSSRNIKGLYEIDLQEYPAPVIIEKYNKNWPNEFEKIKAHLSAVLKDRVIDIHHVGSTSIIGLAAKPIIDIDIEMENYDVFPEIVKQLAKLGYVHNGDQGIKHREAFKETLEYGFMKIHLYVCPSSSEELKRHLLFRDFLNNHKSYRDQYGELKQQLAIEYRNDREAYTDAKSEFVLDILKLAKEADDDK